MNSKFNPSRLGISGLAIRQHIGTLMLTLAVMIVGIFFVTTIQVDLLPSITYPRIGVRIETPGIAPEVAIDEITRPLEQALSATEGVEQVYSQTRENRVRLDLYFKVGGDIDQSLNDATAALNRARNNLPDNLEPPRLFKYDPSQLPVYEFALTSSIKKDVDLRVFADEELARELTVIPGVASVDVSGGVEEEVRVNIDLDRLQALGVGLRDVLDELEERNQDVAGGRLLGENGEPLTRAVGRFKTAEEIRNLSFAVHNNGENGVSQRVYLRDFAEVIDGTEDQRIFVSLNGTPAVKLSVQKQPDANTIEVVNRVKEKIKNLTESNIITDDMTLVTTLDESIFIENSIQNVINSGLIGTGLAALAVLLFLGSLRQTFIIVVSIPLATLGAVILMKIFGLSLNVFSLGGLALGVGIVVDNSIVMLETIAEGVGVVPGKKSKSRLTSQDLINKSISSSQTVESALIASTSTNLVAVLPFLMIGGFISLLFNELILTISFAVAASILVALTIVPMLTSRLLSIRWSSGLHKFWPLYWFNQGFKQLTKSYQWFLAQLLKLRWIVIIIAFVVLGGSSLNLAQQIPQEILPRINTGQAQLIAQFPPNTSLETNRKVMEVTEEIFLQQPETQFVFSTSGGYLFGSNTTENVLRGTSNITLKPGTNVQAYTDRVSQEFDKLNLVDIRLRVFPDGVRGLILNNSPVRRADIDLILQGNDQNSLDEAGETILNVLGEKATLAQFSPDGDPRQPEVQIRPDPERLATFGLNIADIQDSLETAIQGIVATRLQRENRLVDIRVQLDRSVINRPSELKDIPLFTEGNRQIRLGDVAKIEKGKAPAEIQRINQRQVFIIEGNLTEGATLGTALQEMKAILDTIDLPEGVRVLPSYAEQSSKELQSALLILGALAAFLVFVVMAVQYNSLVDPLVIMLTLPLALSGGILGLYITQTAIGATVVVGAILLVGIVVNNAIVLIELANQIRLEKNCDRRTAIIEAAPQRLRPILMTTITTVLGMLPLAIGGGEGGEFLQPLGIVVFSGLSLATLLTLFIIPCFYILLHDIFSLGSSKKKQQKPEFSLTLEPEKKDKISYKKITTKNKP
ncbi:acriflavin resistance protein [Crocosphaera subtropica ATCC 51142]|uniref:Acriflavin resistance protein n=1 Tax=Crocosphaera subtropica (strain ATCC 51142 / BH68) TaxID=43989 RepID=B1WP09_CROS5|nr:efflux RND transporter permease subunit [Crocosphaera subtropica]ACB53188.1 acriflavin resistance protein [Crocosphaera subtropica ATCC 51142]